jgi:hypothetical protein
MRQRKIMKKASLHHALKGRMYRNKWVSMHEKGFLDPYVAKRPNRTKWVVMHGKGVRAYFKGLF